MDPKPFEQQARRLFDERLPALLAVPVEGVTPEEVRAILTDPASKPMFVEIVRRRLELDAAAGKLPTVDASHVGGESKAPLLPGDVVSIAGPKNGAGDIVILVARPDTAPGADPGYTRFWGWQTGTTDGRAAPELFRSPGLFLYPADWLPSVEGRFPAEMRQYIGLGAEVLRRLEENKPFTNARRNSDGMNARVEFDRQLEHIMLALFHEGRVQPYRLFVNNPVHKRALADLFFTTAMRRAKQPRQPVPVAPPPEPRQGVVNEHGVPMSPRAQRLYGWLKARGLPISQWSAAGTVYSYREKLAEAVEDLRADGRYPDLLADVQSLVRRVTTGWT